MLGFRVLGSWSKIPFLGIHGIQVGFMLLSTGTLSGGNTSQRPTIKTYTKSAENYKIESENRVLSPALHLSPVRYIPKSHRKIPRRM